MPLSTGTAILCVWLLAIGLLAVHMEVRNVETGVRIRELLVAEGTAVERLRELQLRYHERVLPGRLEEKLPEEFRTEEGFTDDGRTVFRPPPEDAVEP
jgi:hypothetical protein